MSKPIDGNHSETTFLVYSFWMLKYKVSELVRRKSNAFSNFKIGGISCGTVHKNEVIISRNSKIFNPTNTILP